MCFCYFLTYLGSIQDVAENVNEVKNLTKETNVKIKEGFHKAQGNQI